MSRSSRFDDLVLALMLLRAFVAPFDLNRLLSLRKRFHRWVVSLSELLHIGSACCAYSARVDAASARAAQTMSRLTNKTNGKTYLRMLPTRNDRTSPIYAPCKAA